MHFWKSVHNVVTLGGAYRMDKATERYTACRQEYNRLIGRLTSINTDLQRAISRIKTSFRRTKRMLNLAHKMLYPSCISSRERPLQPGKERNNRNSSPLASARSGKRVNQSSELTALGIAAGTSAAIGAWYGVQVLGIASTGTAIGGIYGAAASNAGWAAFGGGSLATGGGGMALGHLMLPGVGIAIAVGVSAATTHMEANKINKVCVEIEDANAKNTLTINLTRDEVERLETAESIFNRSDNQLRDAVRIARGNLRRFGWLTAVYRWVRFKIKGLYYTPDEQLHLRSLEEAVQKFMATFGVS
jgi:hypothetical protein